MALTVSIIIATKNRVKDLRRTCQVLGQLSPQPLEILITADGCEDATVEFLRSEYPEVKVIVNEQGRGSVASRDRMIREARGDLLLALDDDSYPEQPDCLARIIPLFIQRPQVAVLHFPQHADEYPETLAQTEFGPAQPTRFFASSGAVLRRSVYLQLPGFEPRFFHMYEEPDYALQCVAAGYEIFYSPMVTIRHHYSGAARSEIRNHHQHSRNEFWSTMLRCPFPYVALVAIYRLISQFRYACKRGPTWVIREPLWWWQAMTGIPYCLKNRQPVSWACYKRWLSLPSPATASIPIGVWDSLKTNPSVSVVITTKNRKEELRMTLRSVTSQSIQPEVIVIDDGSTDGTSDLVHNEFPQVLLHRFDESKGLIVRRNDAARLAQGDVIFSIDDDAAFSTPLILEQTLAQFDDPRIGAVAIPYIDINRDTTVHQRAPDHQQVWVTEAYIGTAHALRREVFLRLHGYREHLVHQGEESDYCIRLLAANFVVRLGQADPILHFESARRDSRRMDFYGCRNTILFAWQNIPMPYLPAYLFATTLNCLRWTFDPKRFPTRLAGILIGYRDCLKTKRAPVSRAIYQHWRRLKKNSATPLDSLWPQISLEAVVRQKPAP